MNLTVNRVQACVIFDFHRSEEFYWDNFLLNFFEITVNSSLHTTKSCTLVFWKLCLSSLDYGVKHFSKKLFISLSSSLWCASLNLTVMLLFIAVVVYHHIVDPLFWSESQDETMFRQFARPKLVDVANFGLVGKKEFQWTARRHSAACRPEPVRTIG